MHMSDTNADWTDERIWDEIRLRLNNDQITNGLIQNIELVPLRSVKYAPVQYRNLYLLLKC